MDTVDSRAVVGGHAGNGDGIELEHTIGVTPAGGNIILSWPTTSTGFTLQSTTNLVSPLWTTNLPAPVVVNGQNTVTNPISGTRKFYRLSQ